MWGKISPEVIAREKIYQTPGAETHFIRTVLGKRLAVEVMGDPDGYPVILQPGTPPVMAENAPPGAKVISVYRPGYGFSCFNPYYSISGSAYMTTAIARYFGIRQFGLVGRSGGAGHMLGAVVNGPSLNLFPESCAAIVPFASYDLMGESFFTGMGELNTKVFRALFSNDSDYRPPTRGRRPILGMGSFSSDDYALNSLRTLRAENTLLLNAYSDEVSAGRTNDTGARKRFAVAHAAALRFGNWGRFADLKNAKDWDIDLTKITIPTLVWAAESDLFTPPAHARRIAECIGSAATLHIEPNATHHDGVDATTIGIQWCLDHAG